MKGRSKDAARQRRENEKAQFQQLARLLPLSPTLTSQLDTASIIRLTLSYSCMRNIYPVTSEAEIRTRIQSSDETRVEFEAIHQDLDWFLLMLSPEGKIIYISRSATKQLGIPQHELIGTNIVDYVNNDLTDDQNCLREVLTVGGSEHLENAEMKLKRNFSLRLRCMLSKRSAGLTITNSNLKTIHFTGYLKLKLEESESNGDGQPTKLSSCKYKNLGLLAIGQTITPNHAVAEIPLDQNTFMFRTTEDLKIVFVESRLTTLTGYEPNDLLNQTLYQFIHPDDMWEIRLSHQEVIWKTQSITKYYRFLTLNGGWIWSQSTFTMVHNPKSSRPMSIVSVNQVLSKREAEHEILGLTQLRDQENFKIDFLHSLRQQNKSKNATQLKNSRPLKRKLSEHALQPNSEAKVPRYNLNDSCGWNYENHSSYPTYNYSNPVNYIETDSIVNRKQARRKLTKLYDNEYADAVSPNVLSTTLNPEYSENSTPNFHYIEQENRNFISTPVTPDLSISEAISSSQCHRSNAIHCYCQDAVRCNYNEELSYNVKATNSSSSESGINLDDSGISIDDSNLNHKYQSYAYLNHNNLYSHTGTESYKTSYSRSGNSLSYAEY